MPYPETLTERAAGLYASNSALLTESRADRLETALDRLVAEHERLACMIARLDGTDRSDAEALLDGALEAEHMAAAIDESGRRMVVLEWRPA